MDSVFTFISSALASGLGIALVAWLGREWIESRIRNSVAHEYAVRLEQLRADLTRSEITRQQVWLIKRDACLRAMNIADALLSNYLYPNVPKGEIVPQDATVAEVRACINALASTCDHPDVLRELRRILFEPVRPDAIVDIRNAVRRELGFSNATVDEDRERAFVGRVVSDPATRPAAAP